MSVSGHKVEVVRLASIEPHPNADRMKSDQYLERA